VLNRNLEWSIAGLECRSLHKDAHLLIINDAEEQTAVAGMLESTSRLYTLHVLLYFYSTLFFVFSCITSELSFQSRTFVFLIGIL